jgi:hypothetical protein
MARNGMMSSGDRQLPNTPCAYADSAMEELLFDMHSEIEHLTNLSLFPTYSYFRVYQQGDVLARHTDRPSCEVSVTITLGCEKLWPIWIKGPVRTSEVFLPPGDALLYRGLECEHWRDECLSPRHAQVFLHYVEREGPHSEWRLDKRLNHSRRETISAAGPAISTTAEGMACSG